MSYQDVVPADLKAAASFFHYHNGYRLTRDQQDPVPDDFTRKPNGARGVDVAGRGDR